MAEKLPDIPVVHLPWSEWTALQARLAAVEARLALLGGPGEPPICEACGEPATRQDSDGVWLCEGDYRHMVDHWLMDGGGL